MYIFISIIVIFSIFFLTFGYSAFSDNLSITNNVAHVRVEKVVRINSATSSSVNVYNLEFDSNSVMGTASIPAGESITYSVTVTNLGNVPVAVSNISLVNSNGETIDGLSTNISTNNYVKICDGNNCTGPVSKTFDIIVSNDSGNAISANLDTVLTFSQLFTVTYEGNPLGDEVLEGEDYSYTFESNPPANIALTEGDHDDFSYIDETITITNVQSDITLLNAYTITYNAEKIGYASEGGTFTKNFEPNFPATIIKDSGTCDPVTYQNHILTITNVQSDISLIGTIGDVAITRIQYVDSHNVVDPEADENQPEFSGMDVSFNVVFRKDEESTDDTFDITYEVDLTNTHYNAYIFRGFDFHPTITASAESDTANLTLTPINIANGDIIESETTRTFRVTLTLEVSNPEGEYTTGGTTTIDTTAETTEETGEITATILPNIGNLKSPNTEAEFTVNVTSTYPSDREFNLISSNSNLEIVACNAAGAALSSQTIHANSEEEYTICIRTASGATFIENTASTQIFLSSNGLANISVGSLTLDVDIYDVPDTTPIKVGDVTISMHRDTPSSAPTTGQIDVSWKRIDRGGSSVDKYYIQLYDNNGTLVKEIDTESTATSYQITGLSNGNYHAVVYGLDKAKNSGASYASSQTSTSDGYASASDSLDFTWTFNVDISGVSSNLNPTTDTLPAKLEQPFKIYFTGGGTTGNNNEYYITPAAGTNKLTVYMGETAITQGNGDNNFTYTRTSASNLNNAKATLTINKVTGDIRVVATPDTYNDPGCLIEGTKILLANGKYKNIENIGYDDLLLVYNHETGKFVSEYPIWLEKEKTTDKYQEITFSDGSVLKTFSVHGMFDIDLNRFVNVIDKKEFHVGSRVLKLNENKNGFYPVTVTNIETKNETVKYYHVVTSIYFNNIANGLFVSDGHVNLLNRYGFTENMVWNKEVRDYARQDVYKYEELQDVLPLHIFKGTLAEEAKVLIQSGYGVDEFKNFISLIGDEKYMMLTPMKRLNKNVWMVTTSLDNVNDLNKSQYLRYEGSTYTLPKVNDKNFIGWLNYTDNLIYQPDDKITVYHGMHFEAIYK